MPLYVRTLLITATPADVEDVAPRHLDHLRQLAGQGKLRAAGALGGNDGYLEIFEAADRLEAESIARESPLIVEGLATWMLREWHEMKL